MMRNIQEIVVQFPEVGGRLLAYEGGYRNYLNYFFVLSPSLDSLSWFCQSTPLGWAGRLWRLPRLDG
jgi:hypothetical protein